MSLMLGQLYKALKSAGASEDEAQKAASEVAGYETRLAKIETDLAVLKGMVATVIGLCMAILFKVFS